MSNLGELSHSASSRFSGRLVSAVTEAKVSSEGYPSMIAFVMAQPVMPLAPFKDPVSIEAPFYMA